MKLNVKAVDLEFDEKAAKLYADTAEVGFSVRCLEELKEVLFNKNLLNDSNKNDILYRMFRAAGQEKEQTIFGAHNIRYDVTVMEHYDLGGEFNKTLGHYHPICKKDLAYPELYEVISGEVLYLLQKKMEDGHYDVKLIHAKKGDKVIMEPDYGHISINIGKERLIEANLVNATFASDYAPIKELHGGAVYVTEKKNVIINKNYGRVSITHMDAPKIPFLDQGKSLYDEYIAHPEHFIFLNDPEFLLWEHDAWDLATQHF